MSFKTRGGCSIYARNGIAISETNPPQKFKESCWVETTTVEGKKRLYACIYRSPNSDSEENHKLLNNIAWAKTNFQEIVLIGDFNLPSIDWATDTATGIYAKEFLECCIENNLEQMIEFPTRHRSGQESSLLDLILTNEPDCIRDIYQKAPFGKSDHEVIEFSAIHGHQQPTYVPERYNFRKMDISSFTDQMDTVDWDHQIETSAPSETYKKLTEEVKPALEVSTPKHKLNANKKAPWSSKKIEKMSKKKRIAWDRYKRTGMKPDSPEHTQYKSALNDFNQAKNAAVYDYELRIVEGRGKNPKSYYAYLSKKSKYKDTQPAMQDPDGTIHTDGDECAKILNGCFGKVFNKGKSGKTPEIKTPRVEVNMPEVLFTTEKVLKKLKSLNISKAAGPDEIPAILLKKTADYFAPILAKLFQKSYQNSEVPLGLKEANITPIHKGGSKKDPSNYRPISITPIIAKIYESIIYDDLYAHIETNQVIAPNQHGFQKGKSTATNLLDFWDEITKIADQANPLSIVYTDLRKAFDTVPHDLLLSKLEHYGIRDKNLEWIRSFLTDRKQRVVLNGHTSPFIEVTSGVPQGGILSGLFFIIYMNDLYKHIHYCQVSLYADDTKLFAPVNDMNDISRIQLDIDAFHNWCQRWRLMLNPKKCFFIHYNPRNSKKNFNPDYRINAEKIERKTRVSDLGLIITEDLKFHGHVDKICKNAKGEISRIRRSFMSRAPNFLSNVYKTYVRPHLEYVVQVWNPEYAQDKVKLEKIQNRLTRLLPHGKVLSPTERNQALRITSHETRRLRGDLIQMYKLSQDDSLSRKQETRTRTNSKAIVIERSNTNLRAHSFHCRTSRTWNNLPEEIVSAPTLNAFKTKIDQYLETSG